MEKKRSALYLAQASAIAAIYVVLTLVFAPISFGAVQIRIAEALTILLPKTEHARCDGTAALVLPAREDRDRTGIS